jgi:hypothetical protein
MQSFFAASSWEVSQAAQVLATALAAGREHFVSALQVLLGLDEEVARETSKDLESWPFVSEYEGEITVTPHVQVALSVHLFENDPSLFVKSHEFFAAVEQSMDVPESEFENSWSHRARLA